MKGNRQTNVDDLVRKMRLKKLLKRDVHYDDAPIKSIREGNWISKFRWRKLIGVFMRVLCNTGGSGVGGIRLSDCGRRGGEEESPPRVASANWNATAFEISPIATESYETILWGARTSSLKLISATSLCATDRPTADSGASLYVITTKPYRPLVGRSCLFLSMLSPRPYWI